MSADSIAEMVMDDAIGFHKWKDLAPYIKRHGLPISHPHYGIVHNGSIYMDYVFKLENIEYDWEKICELIGESKSLPWKNNTSGVNKEVYLSEEVRCRLIRYYAGDFSYFGYEAH